MIGQQLGPYQVLSKLGEGGMGEVYRATDTNLKRQVALKVLPESVAADPDRVGRFQREAQVLASINHPHIAQVYGVERSGGVTALVMELVEGEDLSERIARGPMPIADALTIARQIADALEAAHERGIIHRDLKPANVKVGPDDSVKVLDFGLAKALDPGTAEPPNPRTSEPAAPTMTSPAMTAMGMILGTAAYMSPEQARGKPVDRRADIWAFGVVLYEMLTGRRAFPGDEVADVLVGVLSRDLDLTALPAATPARARHLLARCLDRNPRTRLRDIGEARVLLESGTDETTPPPSADSWRERWAVPSLVVAGLALALASVAWLTGGASTTAGGTTGVLDGIVDLGASVQLQDGAGFALSPDGSRLAFIGRDETAATALWIRDLDGPGAVRLAGTERATYPFWSPDGSTLGFYSDGRLHTIDPVSGERRTLCPTNDGRPEASWSRTGTIIFAHEGVIYRTDATGSVCQPVTTLGDGDLGHVEPHFLPDGRHFTFRRQPGYAVRIADIADGTYQPWIEEAGSVQIVAPDWVLYTRNPVTTVTQTSPPLLARRFDPGTLAFTAAPAVVLPKVFTPGGRAAYSAASSGVLVAVVDNPSYDPYVWVTRSGEVVESFPSHGTWTAAVSPNGRSIAMGGFGLWLQDRGRDVATQLGVTSTDHIISYYPSWNPDGQSVAFTAYAPGPELLKIHHVTDGTTDTVFDSGPRHMSGTTWAPDGRAILFWRESSDTAATKEIWEYSLDRKEARAVPGTLTADDVQGEDSCQSCVSMAPRERWLLYTASVDGVVDVYLRRNLETGSAIKVSSQGGNSAYWSADGKTIYYLAPSGAVMAVDVTATSLSTPRLVLASAFGLNLFGVADDGNLFLRTQGNVWTSQPLRLLVNWPRRAAEANVR